VVKAFLALSGPVRITRRIIDRRDDRTLVSVGDHKSGGRMIQRLMSVVGGGNHWPGGRWLRPSEGKTTEIETNTKSLRVFALHR
jgi:hypothetical protein